MSQTNENPFYPSGGGGFLAGGSPFGGSPGGYDRVRPGGSHSLRPLSIKQIRSATQPHSEGEWKIDGVDVGQITVVAYIIRHQTQATNIVYNLEDGTGVMEARHWNDSSEEENPEELGIVDGIYVRVIGTIKAYNDKRYINATRVRVCTDPMEPYYHIMDAVVTKLMYERGHPNRPLTQVAGTHGTSATTLPLAADAKGTSPYTTPSQKLPEAYAHLPQMERSICQFLIKQPPQDEGIHIKVITKGVPGAGASDVSAALDRLLDEGHVFTTMDDSHYALSV